ncbi:DoxX family protein [Leekyejoonella antrihumi]|uniref:DoxX family protein n=1 Tax=Leekyejoonella antrihumi TaxID=1660198 RepID=A0A563DUC6_9MICO|nr:DoxX family protein [Leekyejoonella antrihumi]TWP33533.1 DoxX family protein [Leekyejoonella antrihumi]
MQFARLAARTVVGGLFIGHGTQKLMGWFGGPGLEGTEKMMDALQMYPTRRNALAAGATETVGGALLATGLATPLAASSLIGVMTTAIRKVHAPNGVWSSGGGYEYNITIIAALATLVESGPGKLSLDHALGIEKRGSAVALGATALGVAASYATVELGRRAAERHARLHPAAPEDSAAQ